MPSLQEAGEGDCGQAGCRGETRRRACKWEGGLNMATIVKVTPNTGSPMKEVWAFVSRDKEGRENAIGCTLGPLGATPMITGNPDTLKIFKPLVAEVREAAKGVQTIHLLHFTNREEIEEW
jgi:hypothetical protein